MSQTTTMRAQRQHPSLLKLEHMVHSGKPLGEGDAELRPMPQSRRRQHLSSGQLRLLSKSFADVVASRMCMRSSWFWATATG